MTEPFELARPWALAALVLPALLAWFARRPRPPRECATGTLAVWRELLAHPSASRARSRRGLPPRLVFVLLALVLGSIALAGPRSASREPQRALVALDLRPAAFLPWIPPGGGEPRGRRVDVALDALRAEGVHSPTWTRFDGRTWRRAEGDAPPADWLRAPRVGGPPPPWSEVDRPGAWILTDRPLATREASWIASGGGAVPGLVGRRAGRELAWTGTALVLEDVERPPPLVALGAEVPEDLVALTAAWARERGLLLRSKDGDTTAEDVAQEPALHVAATAPSAGTRRVRGAGWSLVAGAAAPPDGPVLWRAADGAVALAGGPGRLALALREPFEVEEGREAFGLAWIAAIEDAVLQPAGAVSVADRRAAGETTVRIGTGSSRVRTPGTPFASFLAVLALLCAAVGLRGPALRV